MTLPPSYSWLTQSLEANDSHPKMVTAALSYYGVSETRDAAQVIAWRNEIADISPVKKIGVKDYATDLGAPHRIPWCGLFMAHIAHGAGCEFPDHPLWAQNWQGFGLKSPLASLGDVLVFHRVDSHGHEAGHVGIYVGENHLDYFVLGGNERDMVCIVPLLKSRIAAIRRQPYHVTPANVRPYQLTLDGEVSSNEA